MVYAQPRWYEREGKILEVIADAESKGRRLGFTEVVEVSGLDPLTAQMGLEALLDGGYVRGVDARDHDGFEYLDLRLLPLARERLGEWPTDVPTTGSGGMELFISHSSRDDDLARALIRLLRSALSIPADQIRCTSVDGYRLPGGADTKEQLRQEIFGSQAFVGLISPQSLKSSFVLFELGARWGAKKHLMPLLVRGVTAKQIPEPLAGLNAPSGDSEAQVHQLISDLAKVVGRQPAAPAVYQGEIDELLALNNDDEF